MFDKAGEMAKPVNAGKLKIRGAFLDTPLKYEDRDIQFVNGDVCKLRIMEPGPADYNWWQAMLVNTAEGEEAQFPPDCYADIIIRSVYDPDTGEPVFSKEHRDSLKRSGEQQIAAIALAWLRKIKEVVPSEALKNCAIPEGENSTSSGLLTNGKSDPE